MGLREEKKERLRQELYETAMSLFRQKGYDGTRVHDIVDHVRVSEATFFNYFPTKDAVLQRYAADTKHLYSALLRESLSRPDTSVPDRLHDVVNVVGTAFDADVDFMAKVVRQTNIFFGSTDDAGDLDIENFALLASLFSQGQERGEIRTDWDPSQLAEILTAVCLLTITNWLDHPVGRPDELQARLRAAIDILLKGCCALAAP